METWRVAVQCPTWEVGQVGTNGGPEDRYYTVGDVAKLWKVSQQMVYRLAALGELPCIRIGRAVRFRPQDLAVYEQRSIAAPVGNGTR